MPSSPSAQSPFDRSERVSGILCHATSLATDFSIGDLGPAALDFIDFLANAQQTIWQWLPVGPPAHNHSPYSCYSAMAGSRLLISPQRLLDLDLVTQAAVDEAKHQPSRVDRVEFDAIEAKKDKLLDLAYQRFVDGVASELAEPFEAFKQRTASWLIDFARFEAIANHVGELDWTKWPGGLPERDPAALQTWDERLRDTINRSCFVQFLFDHQWSQMKQHAASRGIRLCGDMPIFVAHESSDVWANQELFCLATNRQPALVAGVPPDYFSKTGQLWGNPLYDWKAIESAGFDWWTQRFARSLEQFDLMRVDHFRGFEAYWEIPAGDKTAVGGRWVEGPGAKPFRAAEQKLGPLPLIAEDLGMITDAVYQLRDELDFPGMRVMQFGYGSPDDDFHRPTAYPSYSVAYTGTHDNDTLMGWYKQQTGNPVFKQLLADQLEPVGDAMTHWKLIDQVLQSDAFIAIFPVQDVLGLDNAARMNVPGRAKGNWNWRLDHGMLSASVAQQLAQQTLRANRAGDR